MTLGRASCWEEARLDGGEGTGEGHLSMDKWSRRPGLQGVPPNPLVEALPVLMG